MTDAKTEIAHDVLCSCCGDLVQDNSAENAWHGLELYPGDKGFGMCRRCGGDPDARDPRERLGLAFCHFVDARIAIVAGRLREENRKRFLASSYEAKAAFVLKLVTRGWLP